MIQTNKGLAKPRNKNIIMGPSGRPKRWGRRNPHSGLTTRKLNNIKPEKQANRTSLTIEAGLTKINTFILTKRKT